MVKNHVDDLQGMFSDCHFARKDSRTIDVVVLEEWVYQMLREWQLKLSIGPLKLLQCSRKGDRTHYHLILRLLQHLDDEGDATGVFAAPETESHAQRNAQLLNSSQHHH